MSIVFYCFIVIVIGVFFGIGCELVYFFVKDGYDLFFVVDEVLLEEVVVFMCMYGGYVEVIQVDFVIVEGVV